jgi:MFS family permease
LTANFNSAVVPDIVRTSRGGSVLIGALVVDSIGNGLFLPLGLIFFTRVTTVPLTMVGLLLSLANLTQLPIPMLAGTLADRFGALWLVSVAQALQAIGYGVAGLVRNPVEILISAVMTSVGVRLFWSTVFTAIADYVDGSPGSRGKDYWYGWANMARTAGLGIGGVITGIAMTVPGDGGRTFRSIAFGAAACFVVAATAIAIWVRATRPGERATTLAGYVALVRDWPYLSIIGVNAVYAMSTMVLSLSLPTVVLIELHGPAWLVSALLVTVTVLVSSVTAAVVARLERFRRTRTLTVAACLWATWSLLFAALRPGHLGISLTLLIAGSLLYCAATVVHAPISAGLAAAAAPIRNRGLYLAAFQYSYTFAEIVGPGFFATLFAIHAGLPWLGLAALNVMTVGALLALERRLPPAALRM